MSTLSDQIFELRSQNKSYNEIQKELKCSKSTISYYLAKDGKEKNQKRLKKRRSLQSILSKKLETFRVNKKIKKQKNNYLITRQKAIYKKLHKFNGDSIENMVTEEQLLNKIGPNPICYLTGLPIDLDKPSSYELDHIMPRSRGGDNSIDNLGLCTKQANRAKGNLTKDEFIYLCKLIANNN